MTIQELATEAGVTTRTIRYYVEQGVLPAPDRGRPAEYTEEHLNRLALIRRLKEQYLPLDEIRSMLARLSDEQVRDLLSREETRPEPEPPKLESAADYIAHVLDRSAVREEMVRYAPPPQPAPLPAQRPVAPGAPPPNVSQPYSSGPRTAQSTTPGGWIGPTPAQGERATRPSPPAPAAFTPAGEQAAVPSGSAWHRVPIDEGIEIHYRASDDDRFLAKVARLISAIRHILEDTPGKNTEEE